MSKDKGSKNHKKAPADKSSGKQKIQSAYKAEGNLNVVKPGLEVFNPKMDTKPAVNQKSGKNKN